MYDLLIFIFVHFYHDLCLLISLFYFVSVFVCLLFVYRCWRNTLLMGLFNSRPDNALTTICRCIYTNCSEVRMRKFKLAFSLQWDTLHMIIDHDLLLQRLRVTFGINGTSLEWISSFLSDRTFHAASV